MSIEALRSKLQQFNQLHVLQFWDVLSKTEQEHLVNQIEAIDLEQIKRLSSGPADDHDWAALARKAEPPKAIRISKTTGTKSDDSARETAKKRGEEALAAGEIGVLLVAGGQGTRLGFEHPKGMYPIGPVQKTTVFQIIIEKVLAVSARYQVRVPLYLMTSPATHEETVQFLNANNNFGLPEEDLIIFCQGTMPAVCAKTGKLLLASRSSLFLSPDGHGGTIAGLQKSGAIEAAHTRGIKQLFYLQIDNPLVPICDEEFIGHHLLNESELSSIAVPKDSPQDKLGNFVSIAGRTEIIEYIDFPDDVAEQLDSEGNLRFWAGSIAVHIFDVAFLNRVLELSTALPFHIANKKVSYVNEEGKIVTPEANNALKFERFIFDLLPEAKNAIVVEGAEEDFFGPLKNAPGAEKHTAEHIQSMLSDQYARWLKSAGADVSDKALIEISPLFAHDEQAVKQKVIPGTVFSDKHYLS